MKGPGDARELLGKGKFRLAKLQGSSSSVEIKNKDFCLATIFNHASCEQSLLLVAVYIASSTETRCRKFLIRRITPTMKSPAHPAVLFRNFDLIK
jgi:hypothetical protein